MEADTAAMGFPGGWEQQPILPGNAVLKPMNPLQSSNHYRPKTRRFAGGFAGGILRDSNFKPWRGDVKDADELAARMKLHTDPLAAGAKTEDILCELLLKSGVPLTAPMRDKGGWWLAEDAAAKIAVALTRIDAATVKDMLAAGPDKVIALGRLFQGNDQLKTNTVLQMEDAGVGFEAV